MIRLSRIRSAAFVAIALAVPGLAAAGTPSGNPGTSPVPSTTMRPSLPSPLSLRPQIALACSGSGASDVASRKHSITNNAGHSIPKGTTLRWSSSDKGSGSLVLTSALAPNASVDVTQSGQTNGYTCTAHFDPGPADFAVVGVKWIDATTTEVQVANVNPWTDAAASVGNVTSMKCLQAPVAALGFALGPIPKGGSVKALVKVGKLNADYVTATANANNAVQELATNKANNTLKSSEFLTNKSCTPQ
jgi:hypothetical protein